jgi:RNA polymerase sigma-70 factor, ECF subfamily
MHTKREAELIAAGKGGDQAAIAELFERHYPSSLRVARGILRSEEESQDAVQSAYLSAFRHLNTFRGDSAFKTWIGHIVTNHCLMRLRQPWRRIHRVDLDALTGNGAAAVLTSPEISPEKSTFCGEIATALADAAAKLPKTLCEVFHLYAIAGLTVREVAQATGLTLPAAKSRLFRAHAQMREHLQPVWVSVRTSGGPARSNRRDRRERSSFAVRSEAA